VSVPTSVTAKIVTRLRAAGCVFAEDEADLLVDAAGDPAELDAMVARRVSGEPLEQVVGWAEFCGLRISLAPGVFTPRRRTEFLARTAAALARPNDDVVDLCCGSGAIGAAVAAWVTPIELHACDIDAVAVRCARANLADVGHVYTGDLYAALPVALRGRVNVLVANVPYVPTHAIETMPPEARDHEPHSTLDGGPDGLDVLRRVAAEAPRWLASGGCLLIETSERQAPIAVDAFISAGLATRVATDDEIGATIIIGVRS
jgi:release factor glutamine methyltransferase